MVYIARTFVPSHAFVSRRKEKPPLSACGTCGHHRECCSFAFRSPTGRCSCRRVKNRVENRGEQTNCLASHILQQIQQYIYKLRYLPAGTRTFYDLCAVENHVTLTPERTSADRRRHMLRRPPARKDIVSSLQCDETCSITVVQYKRSSVCVY